MRLSFHRRFWKLKITSFWNLQVSYDFQNYVFSKKSLISVKSECFLRKLEILLFEISVQISKSDLKFLIRPILHRNYDNRNFSTGFEVFSDQKNLVFKKKTWIANRKLRTFEFSWSRRPGTFNYEFW